MSRTLTMRNDKNTLRNSEEAISTTGRVIVFIIAIPLLWLTMGFLANIDKYLEIIRTGGPVEGLTMMPEDATQSLFLTGFFLCIDVLLLYLAFRKPKKSKE
jgi:hypothetical protein